MMDDIDIENSYFIYYAWGIEMKEAPKDRIGINEAFEQ